MLNFEIDYTQIILEEHIPLTSDDLIRINEKRKFHTIPYFISAVPSLIITGTFYWCIKNEFKIVSGYHYLLLTGISIGVYALCYFIVRSENRSKLSLLEKDIQSGKCKITTQVISHYKNEDDEILILAGPPTTDSIHVMVEIDDYRRYEDGAKVIVTYLKYSRMALLIEKFRNSKN